MAEQIDLDRRRYREALVEADAAWRADTLDVSRLQDLVDDFLERQLAYYLEKPFTDPPL